MKEVQLTRGYVALVDDEDFGLVSAYKWRVLRTSGRRTMYAITGGGCRANKQVFMHRLLLGPTTGQHCDHRNSNGLDNRRGNLRLCTKSQNGQNRRKGLFMNGKRCSSAYKGVYWQKACCCWEAGIKHNGKTIHLGYFDDERDASLAYDAKARELFGEFALLNSG